MEGIQRVLRRGWARWLVLLLFAPGLSLASEVVIAVQPIVVVDGEDSEAAGFEELVRSELESRGAHVSPRAQVVEALHGCGDDDACVGTQLAQIGATHVVQISVAPYAPRVTAAARVLASGVVVQAPPTVESSPGEDRTKTAQDAVRKVVRAIELGSLEVARVPEVVSTGVSAQPIPWMRAGAYVGMGLGTATAIAGGAMAVFAQRSASELDGQLIEGNLPARDESARQLYLRSENQRGQAIGLLAGGGALIAAGAVLYVLSEAEAPVAIAPSTSGSGVSVSISGAF